MTSPQRQAEFLSPLLVRVLTDELFILTADFGFYAPALGREHWVRRGKPTDFASVPRVPLAYWLTGGKAKWEAVGHDDLCDRPDICDRATADRVFVELMQVSAEFRLFGEDAQQLIELQPKKQYKGVQIHPDGSVTIFKRPQKPWRRQAMGAGVRIGASWDDFTRGLREPDQSNQETP